MGVGRTEFPRKVKAAAFERAKGFCEGCGAKLATGRIEYDHRVPDALGGKPTLDNCVVLCKPCHGEKTARGDVPRIAKAKRQRDRHIGAYTTKSVIPGSRKSKWKRKLDGTVVLR